MILALDGKGAYRQCLGADITDRFGLPLCAVGSRLDVVQFVSANPDTEFLLMTPGVGAGLAEPNLERAVICGKVMWDSRLRKLINDPIPLSSRNRSV